MSDRPAWPAAAGKPMWPAVIERYTQHLHRPGLPDIRPLELAPDELYDAVWHVRLIVERIGGYLHRDDVDHATPRYMQSREVRLCVRDDMRECARSGRVNLTDQNQHLLDAYQLALDLLVYLTAAEMEAEE